MEPTNAVELTVENGVARIALNRPDVRNAVNLEMRQELLRIVRWVSKSDEVRVAVLTANGDSFCAGADLAEDVPPEQWVEDRINAEYKPFLMAIADSPKPFIASVKGAAAGVGCAIALVCDMVVMSEKAFFLQAFAKIGLIPDGGASWHLSRAFGPKVAFEMLMGGQKISAQQSLQAGLVNRVVPEDDLDTETREMAQMLAARAPLSAKYTKQAIREGADMSLFEAISLEARLQNVPRESEDFEEGRRAFFEKRAPNWRGR